MKALHKSLKTIAIFLSALLLLQSCSTYRTPVNLQKAVLEEKAVKIITVDDVTYKYKYIVYEDGLFYGIKDNPGEDVKFLIDIAEVEEVLMKKGTPWWLWVILGAALAVGLGFLIASLVIQSEGYVKK